MRVRIVERARNRVEDTHDLCEGHPLALIAQRGEPILQRPSAQILQHHKRLVALRVHVKIVQLHDVRMTERSHDLRLAAEALAETRIARQMRIDHLDRDRTFEDGIARQKDLCHPAAPQPARDDVLAEDVRPRLVEGLCGH